ncbi:hypothetical protein [Subdoligranulum variabile]|uniref:hypothetical protein n=1 Tax=Subdoligranulum variabile TaxID=214851 RepID=UPI0026ED7A89|nr:hypothetical protein [Subdoligranulum variabile]
MQKDSSWTYFCTYYQSSAYYNTIFTGGWLYEFHKFPANLQNRLTSLCGCGKVMPVKKAATGSMPSAHLADVQSRVIPEKRTSVRAFVCSAAAFLAAAFIFLIIHLWEVCSNRQQQQFQGTGNQ